MTILEGAEDMETKDKRYMRTREVAEYLSVKQDTVRYWVRKGIIPHSKIGRTILFDRDALDSFISGHSCPRETENGMR